MTEQVHFVNDNDSAMQRFIECLCLYSISTYAESQSSTSLENTEKNQILQYNCEAQGKDIHHPPSINDL